MNIASEINKLKKLYSNIKPYTLSRGYILILVLPLLFNIICYSFSKNTIEEINATQIKDSLDAYRTFVDSSLESIAYCATQLSSNDNILQLAYLDYPLTSQQRLDMDSSNKVWEIYKRTSNYIKNMYIYYPDSNCIYTGTTLTPSHFHYMYTYLNESVMTEQMWNDAILSKMASGFVTIQSGDKPRVFFTYTTHKPTSKDIWFNTIIEVDFDKLIAQASGRNMDNFFVFISDGTVITTSNDEKLISTVRKSVSSEQTFSDNIFYGNGIYRIKSQRTPWEYGYLEKNNSLRRSVVNLQILTLLFGIISVIISLLVIAYIIGSKDVPLKEIATLLPDIKYTNDKNIYTQINKSLEKVLGEKDNYASKLHSQNNILKENVLTNILLSRRTGTFSYKDQLELAGITMDSSMFATIALLPMDLSDMFADEYYNGSPSERQKLSQVIITNILGETLSKYYNTEFVTIENLCIAIINITDEQTENFKSDISSVLDVAFEIIYNEFNFKTIAAVSNIHMSLNRLNDAYNESVMCTEYAFTEKKPIVFFDEMSISSKKTYAQEIENDISRCFEEKNYRQCKKVVENIIYKFQLDKEITTNIARTFAYDLLTTFFKYAIPNSNDSSGKFLAGVEMNNIMSENTTTSSILLNTITIIEKYLSEQDSTIDETSDGDKNNFYQQIKNYIEENYSNPDLSVTELSTIFKTNPSYLSSQFKKEFDIGLLDYITTVRVEMAKKLLTTTDASNDEISKQVGYSNTRTFLRAFSKHENITPKEYRRINNPSI